jgi:hypothetical protein
MARAKPKAVSSRNTSKARARITDTDPGLTAGVLFCAFSGRFRPLFGGRKTKDHMLQICDGAAGCGKAVLNLVGLTQSCEKSFFDSTVHPCLMKFLRQFFNRVQPRWTARLRCQIRLAE